MRELIVHIGPWKTATTAIQRALNSGALGSADNDCAYAISERDVDAHHHLAETLLREDGRGDVSDGWFATDGLAPGSQSFPPLARDRQIISAEALCRLGPFGRHRLMSWAQPEAIHVVAAIRDPLQWLWSTWQQQCKTPNWPEWPNHLENHSLGKPLFPSVFLGVWRDSEVPTRISILDFDHPAHDELLMDFAGSVGLQLDRRYISPRLNATMSVYETLLSAILVERVHDYVKLLYPRAAIPSDFVARSCLDVVDRGRPAFETAARADSDILDSLLRPEADAETAYRLAWSQDCYSVAYEMDEVDEQGRQVLMKHALHASQTNGPDGPHIRRFPIADVRGRAPLDSDSLAMARSIAAAIGAHWRATQQLRNAVLPPASAGRLFKAGDLPLGGEPTSG